MGRINELDYIRVVAVVAVLLCHYFLFSNLNSGVGRYLGGIGNTVFFLTSALLYSFKPITGGGDFILKRVLKLGFSLWPFLLILFILYLIFGVNFSLVNIVLNYAFLGYVFKLPGNGHLWFLTVLMSCYVEMIILDRLNIKSKYFPFLLLFSSIVLSGIAEYFHVSCVAFFSMGFYGFVFLKGKWLYKYSKSIGGCNTLFAIIINIICLYFDYNGLFEYNRFLHYLLTSFCGLFLLVVMLKFMPNLKINVVSFICGISYEFYLVHHTFCAGPFIRITSWEYSHILNILVIVVLSVISACVLNLLGKQLKVIFLK